MKLSIRMTIFLPVMIILIAFPLSFWLIFTYSLDWNMKYTARRDIEGQVRQADQILSARTGQEEGESLLDALTAAVQSGTGETRMMVLGRHYSLLYPSSIGKQEELTELYAMILAGIGVEPAPWENQAVNEAIVAEKPYLVYYREISEGPHTEEADIPAYLLFYCPVHDTAAIQRQVSRLVVIIIAAITALSILLFWFVSGKISGPVLRLSEAARGIGEKKFQKIETAASVKELYELETEINQMQEKLLQADQAERTFFQNASHELRTPLMSISGYAQGIERGVFPDAAQAAGIILDESRRLTEVVDGILTLTRMDQQRYQVTPVTFGIRDFIEAQNERLEGLAYARQIRLVLKDGEDHRVTADAGLLERAFCNVVSNCIRYAKCQVIMETWLLDDVLYIRIQDDGDGLLDEELPHLFDRFYKGKTGNHGLGLAIARASMEYMGGTVAAENRKEQKGAEFLISMPQDCRRIALAECLEIC